MTLQRKNLLEHYKFPSSLLSSLSTLLENLNILKMIKFI